MDVVFSSLIIRLLIDPLPSILFLGSNLALFFYPLDEQRYEELRREIRDREAKMV
jgi:Na+/melibiose symporter-like transporter